MSRRPAPEQQDRSHRRRRVVSSESAHIEEQFQESIARIHQFYTQRIELTMYQIQMRIGGPEAQDQLHQRLTNLRGHFRAAVQTTEALRDIALQELGQPPMVAGSGRRRRTGRTGRAPAKSTKTKGR